MPLLDSKQIKLQLDAVPEWTKRGKTIGRTFKFEGFLKGIAFVDRIAPRAQKLNHHPDIDIRYNKVSLTLSSHDEGGITDLDFALAEECDGIFAKHFGS